MVLTTATEFSPESYRPTTADCIQVEEITGTCLELQTCPANAWTKCIIIGLQFWLRGMNVPLEKSETLDSRDTMADRELDKQEFTALADTIPVTVWTASADGTVDYLSTDFYRFTGIDPHISSNEAWLNAMHPDDRERSCEIWERCVAEETDYRNEFRVLRQDSGEYHWFMACAAPHRDKTGTLVRWYGTAIDIHDRKMAEQDLRQVQERSRMLLQSSPLGIHGIDRSGHVIFQNRAALDILGYSDEEILGRHSHSTIHHHRADGSDYPMEECPIFQTLADGQPRSCDTEVFFRKDGTAVPVTYMIAAMTDPETGEFSGVVINFRDITKELRRQRFLTLEAEVLDAITAGQSLKDILDLTTRSVEEILPGALASILMVDEGRVRHGAAPSLPDEFAEAIDGEPIGPKAGSCGTAAWRGEPVISEDIATDPLWADYKHLALAIGLAACWSVPIKDSDNSVKATFAIYYREPRAPDDDDLAFIHHIARFVGVAMQRARHAEQLRESEERFRLISRTTGDVLWDWDLAVDEIWWSEGMSTRFGHDPEQLPDGIAAWKALLHPGDADRVLESVESVVNNGADTWSEEYRFARGDGSYAQVSDSGYVIKNSRGKALRMVGSMLDVTEVRALEEQLHQAQRLESIGHLTGGIAHDFNNLLTVIQGSAELLEEECAGDDSTASLAGMIRDAASRGADLTSRLLAFARKQALEPRPVDANQLIADLESMLQRTLRANIELEIVRSGGLWPALVDPVQLENALLNLALNARDAMPDGGRLTIETANAALDDDYSARSVDVSPGQYVMVAVTDTGTGMDRETLDQAFEPFFTTKPKERGTGLGLSMVWGFAKQSNGHVRIYSEPDQGTTVRMYLPRTESTVAATEQSDVEPRPAMRTGSERILLVEDNDLVRAHMENSLRKLGYRVESAANGPDAVKLLEGDSKFDLLFTDVVMPGGMNGRKLAERARELRPGLPVLYASGYTQNAIVHQGRLDPGVHLLQKPFRLEEMAAQVRKVLNEGKKKP